MQSAKSGVSRVLGLPAKLISAPEASIRSCHVRTVTITTAIVESANTARADANTRSVVPVDRRIASRNTSQFGVRDVARRAYTCTAVCSRVWFSVCA
jgi:hypothetical protein